jgi:hypothetical protein
MMLEEELKGPRDPLENFVTGVGGFGKASDIR